MPIETTPVTTATTPLSDDEILAHLRAEATRRAANPRFSPGDVVGIHDQAVIDRAQILRPFGVVISYAPVDEIAVVLCVDVRGNEMALPFRGAQVAPMGEGASA